MKKAFITGITGQDGSYLAELLLEKGYEVHGVIRRSSQFNTGRIDHIYQDTHEKGARLFLHYGDLTDSSNISRHLSDIKPDEVYNLGAQSHVKVSFEMPEYTADTDALGTLRLLDAIRGLDLSVRFYQAGSSEMFGKVTETPQSETTPFYPRSPYGVAKVYAHWIAVNYREAYGMHISNGILFNHESPRRGGTFVTKKICTALAKIYRGEQDALYLGNLDAKRDWGYAPDYVDAMYKMLQQKEGDDYVVATGESHSVREFVELAAAYAGFDIEWNGFGELEKGIDKNTGKVIIAIDPKYFRPTEVDILQGDSSKARKILSWRPRVNFEKLVEIMMKAEL